MSDQRLFEEKRARKNGPVECLGMSFESDAARREYFLKRLRERLKDPEFRHTEGFPKGSDEDILALSDPPFYTACPNPFIEEFVKFYGSEYDAETDEYRREPFAADVSEGKNDPIYNAHSYHTKVPHKAIMRYILHYTEPGDIVFDGFCGTGMTGVAARSCSNPPNALRKQIEATLSDVKLGARYPVLCDLSILPTFIASNLNGFTDSDEVASLFAQVLGKAKERFGRYFQTEHMDRSIGTIHYATWSDVFICPNCSNEVVFWDAAVDLAAGPEKSEFFCPQCNAALRKRSLQRAFVQKLDPIIGEVQKQAKRTMVRINYTANGQRHNKIPSQEDLRLAEELSSISPSSWVPTKELPRGDRFFKDGLHLVALTHYHRFYFPRVLHAISCLWAEIEKLPVTTAMQNRLKFIVTSMLDRNLTIRNRFVINKHNPRGRINGPLANTLYVPGLSVEQNPFEALRYKSEDITGALSNDTIDHLISTQSLTSIKLPKDSVDYIFTDPPFGHNIMYSELNGLTESWLRASTNNTDEAIVSEAQKKSIDEYVRLMEQGFRVCHDALKPGRWITVEFHNSRNSVWNAIQESINRAGFVVADVRVLDKQKGTINQEFYAGGAVKQDLAISAYKPNEELERRFELEAGTEGGVWDFVDSHLRQLPVVVEKDGAVEPVAERMGYLLFDRMVAFHVQRGVSVPLSAAEFYAGLKQRYPERDGMYFVPDQVAQYDRKRVKARELLELQLFITGESSAIQWLRQELTKKPQTFQELSPEFMKDLGWAKHEKSLELNDLLKENFLRYKEGEPIPHQILSWMKQSAKHRPKIAAAETQPGGIPETGLTNHDPEMNASAKDRWYVPDPNRAQDLEKLREAALHKEFETYRQATGKRLKVFRLEAVRAGFDKAWRDREYGTIIEVAKKIPETVLQEDPKLLMYYDNALDRMEE